MRETKEEHTLLIELPLGRAAESFDLENTVCSHGLFMMSPNRWDPLSRSLLRPLRLSRHPSLSLMVRISHPPNSHSLHVRVYGTRSLPTSHRRFLLDQVIRMLRLSEGEERKVREFRKMVGEEAEWMGRFSGRVFRSPCLFEDMVKCILLCNCQWPRTLTMAQALCDLQLELQSDDFTPKTPERIHTGRKKITTSTNSLELKSNLTSPKEVSEPHQAFGNFPSPHELAKLDHSFLAKRCKLGYRATRVVKLARAIAEGSIQLTQLERGCCDWSLSSYNDLAEQLSKIEGFGPFTCANVLMCIGFYHVIPADSETIRHLKQVHARNSSVQSIQRDVQLIYGKYAPFQFLAYWAELWNFYEQRFGELSHLPFADYKLITARNMRTNASSKNKRTRHPDGDS